MINENELVQRAKRGDSQAFAQLLKDNYEFLLRYLMKIAFNRDLAQDIVQDTMVKCMENIHLFNGKAKFSSWLITIATNHYVDLLRRKKSETKWREQEQALRKLKWQLEQQNEDWTDLLDALGRLTEEMRIPIVLKHYYGYSYEEIGKMLQIAEGTVKSRVHNGMVKIRKEVTRNGE